MSRRSAHLAACLAAALVALAVAPARAELSRAALAQVGVYAPQGARAPLDARFTDQDGRALSLGAALGGRPGLLVFEDFRCKTLCGPALSIVAAGIKDSGLTPGRDLRLVAVGLNPRETPADARALRDSRLSGQPALAGSSSFLTGAPSAIGAAARGLGYGYAYDAQTDQFTHPVAAFVLAGDGRLIRVLPETALTGPDLRGAIQDADRGRVGDLVDRLAVFCHDLFPLTGRYDAPIQSGLRLAGGATVIAMALGVIVLMRRRRAA